MVKLTSIKFSKFKALEHYSIALKDINILVGQNNSGKSTIISALRVLDLAIKTASRSAPIVLDHDRYGYLGYAIDENKLPLSLENVHTDYIEEDSDITFNFSNGNKLILNFPKDGGCYLFAETTGKIPRGAAAFKTNYPYSLGIIPVLGPLEHKEKILADNTIDSNLYTHRASRHFRNYWNNYPDKFTDFANLLRESWDGIEIEPPEKNYLENIVNMFYKENGITREVFWGGFGFQIWCQLLTHIVRSTNKDLIVVDEPETYLHPDLQRKLLQIIKFINVPILMATHSSEIISEADPTDILIVDKKDHSHSAKRLKDLSGVQMALAFIGSSQNITLTKLATNKKIIFVEGDLDLWIIRRLAGVLNLHPIHEKKDYTHLLSDGFSSLSKIRGFVELFNNALDAKVSVAVISDRDFFCDEEITSLQSELEKSINYVCFLTRKEIENYLLIPEVLASAISKEIDVKNLSTWTEETLIKITDALKHDVSSQLSAKRINFIKKHHKNIDESTIIRETSLMFDKNWQTLDGRLKIVSGKEVLAKFREEVSGNFQFSLTDSRICNAFRPCHIPQDMKKMLDNLVSFIVN